MSETRLYVDKGIYIYIGMPMNSLRKAYGNDDINYDQLINNNKGIPILMKGRNTTLRI